MLSSLSLAYFLKESSVKLFDLINIQAHDLYIVYNKLFDFIKILCILAINYEAEF